MDHDFQWVIATQGVFELVTSCASFGDGIEMKIWALVRSVNGGGTGISSAFVELRAMAKRQFHMSCAVNSNLVTRNVCALT